MASPVEAVGLHRTPRESAHLKNAQNKDTSYVHDGRADKDSYPYDRHNKHITNTLCFVYNYGYRLASIN